jgi:uncharacterized membrane protein
MLPKAIRRIHPAAGFLGFLTILTFWTSTIAAEALGSHQAILAVKTGILWGMIVLIPSLAVAGATGFRLAGPISKGPVAAKKRRMPFIAANGILILIPCAVFLQRLAAAGDIGTTFYAVQAVELIAGATNITLMGLNIRDGVRMTRGRRAARVAA